jgi:hypothetical protein
MAFDWHATALLLGYPNPVEMLYDLYWNEKLSVSQISTKLNCSTTALNRQMRIQGVELRSRGGNNNKGVYTRRVHRLDPRFVHSASYEQISRIVGSSLNIIYRYKKQRRG